MTTWNELHVSIRETGAINRRMVASIAFARAHRERKTYNALGLPRPWNELVAESFVMTDLRAKTILDNEIALRLRAALPASEQWARTAELQAEIAERAIPPRREEAARFRHDAARLRAAVPHRIAAE